MKKTNLLIFGNEGMFGHVVEKYFKEKEESRVIGLNRSNLDMNDFSAVIENIVKIKPHVIINCVGVLNTGDDIHEFSRINVALPRILAYMGNRHHIKIIHISTNCVFKEIGPHKQNEAPNATDIYGMSKALGEIDDDFNLTIRTSITGPELKEDGSGLFNWFMQSNKKVTGYSNAFWNGVTTFQLAQFIEEAIEKKLTGIVNYYTIKEESKYELLKIINEVYGLKKTLMETTKEGVHSSLLEGKHFTKKTFKEQFKELKEWYK